MQVNTSANTQYVTTVDQTTKTQKSEKSSEEKFDMTQPFDIDSFTFEDYKAIDRKDLGDWIKNSNLPNEKEVSAKAGQLKGMTDMTNDDTFNRVLFDKTNESYDETGKSLFLSVFVPLADMREGGISIKEKNPSSVQEFEYDPSSLTGGRRTAPYFFEIEDMLSNMKGFPEFYNKLGSESKSLMGDVRDTYQAFDGILTEYSKRKDNQNAILEAYTKNNKQNPSFS
jgi:hypothetical protein